MYHVTVYNTSKRGRKHGSPHYSKNRCSKLIAEGGHSGAPLGVSDDISRDTKRRKINEQEWLPKEFNLLKTASLWVRVDFGSGFPSGEFVRVGGEICYDVACYGLLYSFVDFESRGKNRGCRVPITGFYFVDFKVRGENRGSRIPIMGITLMNFESVGAEVVKKIVEYL